MLRNIVISVILLTAVYFIFFQSQPNQVSFDQGKNRIDAFWDSESIDPNSIDSANLDSVNEADLKKIKSRLESYQRTLNTNNRSESAIFDFANIHIQYVDTIILTKELVLLSAITNLEDDPCQNLSFYNTLSGKTVSLADNTIEKNEKIHDFSSSYPEFADESELFFLLSETSQVEELQKSSSQNIVALNELCEGSL